MPELLCCQPAIADLHGVCEVIVALTTTGKPPTRPRRMGKDLYSFQYSPNQEPGELVLFLYSTGKAVSRLNWLATMAHDNNEVQYPASESSNSIAGDMDKEMEPWTDKFTPFPEKTFPESSGTLVTLPSILVGVICGIMVNGSNIYLGLKTGWTSSANLLGVHFTLYEKMSH